MKKAITVLFIITSLFGLNLNKQEKEFLKKHPIIYIAAMKYWPVDKNGNSIHVNYLNLISKYGHIDLQPVYFKYWSVAYNYAKEGKIFGILGLSYSKSREKYFFYTKPYNFTPYYIIVNKKSKIYSLKDLKNKKVYIAKHSIIRAAFKKRNFKLVDTKHAFKDLADGKIDAIMLFYMPENKYAGKFRILKTYVNRYGKEYLGISRKYPLLYEIIEKIIKQIPRSEIEKIRNIHYHTNRHINEIISPDIKFSDVVTSKDIAVIVLFLLLLGTVVFVYMSKIFMKLSIKRFFISVFLIYSVIVAAIIYEIGVYSYFSKRILAIKSRSFNALYLIDKLNMKIIEWNLKYFELHKKSKKEKNLFAFKINGKKLSAYLNYKYFNDDEIKYLSKLSIMFNNLERLQQQALKHKINPVIYRQKLMEIIEKLDNLRDLIKNRNDREIIIIRQKLKYQLILLIVLILLILVLSAFLFVMMRKKIYIPVENFITKLKENKSLKNCSVNNDEIGMMIKEIITLTDKLNKNIRELQEHKKSLEKKIKEEVKIRVEQEKMLLKQSKFAIMGEMIDAIAHQWKQPLNAISIKVGMLELDKDEINDEYIKNFVSDIYMQIEHMTQTLKEFREFFREDKNDIFCMKRVVDTVLLLLKDELVMHKIEIKKEINVNFCLEGNENEFKHLLISVITNAKDIFIERDIKKRTVYIRTYEDERFYYLTVEDTAGGIPEEIIDKIFNLEFTSRKGGSGIGLYLARKIALKHGGVLYAENTQRGAKFTFKVEK